MKMFRTVVLAALLVAVAAPAFAQFELGGRWVRRSNQDDMESGPGPDPVDYLGLPLNDEGRARGLSFQYSAVSLPEHQCGYLTPFYLVLGPFGLVVDRILDPVSGVQIAWRIGGWVDRALMWFVDLMLVIPGFLIIAILSPAFRGKTWFVFVLLIAAFLWMVTARIVRGMTISLREREYVQAARFMGVSTPRIIFRHILPNISSLLIIDATINVSVAIIGETGLSYFGFGVQPPDVSLGTLIADGTASAVTYPWLFGFAAGLLVLIVLAVNLIGDGLRDAIDPTSGHKS